MVAGGLVSAVACVNDSGFTPTKPSLDDLQPGSVSGRVCEATSLTWLEGAQVYTQAFDENDIPIATMGTVTDDDGRWMIEDLLPSERLYDVVVQYGYEILETHSVSIVSGQNVALAEPECFAPLNVAVVSGSYDDLGALLGDIGVFSYDIVDGTSSAPLSDFLSSYESMESYDVILFNGGHVEEDVIYDLDGSAGGTINQNLTNIQRFVEEGGVIYSTDWSYDIVELIWPSAIDFLGDDAYINAAQLGETGTVSANVTDDGLIGFIGQNTVDVVFDLPVWPVIDTSVGDVTVLLQAPVASYREGDDVLSTKQVPLLVEFAAGSGKVVFSSYRLVSNSDGAMRSTFSYVVRPEEDSAP
jgi:hypothetical protein